MSRKRGAMFSFEIGDFQISWRDFLEIGIIGYIFYRMILIIRGTRVVSIIYGLLVLVLIYYFSQLLSLYTLNWLMTNFLSSFLLMIIIIFQSDIRRYLADVGSRWYPVRTDGELDVVKEVVLACMVMAKKRIGALIVLEKSTPLGDVIEKGETIDGLVSVDLLCTLFTPGTPLHDGAVVIKGKRIRAAGCILPLAVGVRHHANLGTRHRAALGITEETDAVTVVVSEERGAVTVAIGGRLTSALDEVRLQRVLRRAWLSR